MNRRIRVRAAVLDGMLEQARAELPYECCGLLGGTPDEITDVFPTANALVSPSEYFIAPGELIATLRLIRERGLRHRGIYHSHPRGQNFPSRRDIETAYYPACAYFIISPEAPMARAVRVFEIRNGSAAELKIEPV
ncbi:MAG TPA: M67 family metallopeptidase [Terriglobia bacterium]|nr:M67 family metallopeptidase [Terriglobia bacterium]